jgi:hypothetical protein
MHKLEPRGEYNKIASVSTVGFLRIAKYKIVGILEEDVKWNRK